MRLDVYDIVILIDIHRDQASIRKMAEKLPFKKTAIGARIKRLEKIGFVKTTGTKRKAQRTVTKEGYGWLQKHGYLKKNLM